MRNFGISILCILSAVALVADAARAEPDAEDVTGVLTRPPKGSLAAQLQLRMRLKSALEMAGGPSLATSIDHNRQEWRTLSPDQRERFRNQMLAILTQGPEQQEKLIRSYDAYLSLSKGKREAFRRRDIWVRAVVKTFSPAERRNLAKMSAVDRAKALIARRDELVRQGKLHLEPTTAPAEPTTRPAE